MKEMNKINVLKDMELEGQFSLLANHEHIVPSNNLLNKIQAQISWQEQVLWSKTKTIVMLSIVLIVVMLNALSIWSAYVKGPMDASQMSTEFTVNNQLYK
ncbi:MAG: hypothetical protein RLZZ60_1921 [Bacteroidota bacterium]|jgi:hypothetical protein